MRLHGNAGLLLATYYIVIYEVSCESVGLVSGGSNVKICVTYS